MSAARPSIRLSEELKKDRASNSLVHLYKARIEDFQIEEASYDCIIANNSLPFIQSKLKATEVIHRIFSGLKHEGCAYVTFFGIRDSWSTRSQMNFWEFEEILAVVDACGGHVYHSVIEEGFGKTLHGDIKYWNVFKLICRQAASVPSAQKAA